MSDTCEWEGCSAPAVCEVNAQWSIADFVAYRACQKHVWEMRAELEQRTVDGLSTRESWVVWWELDA